jgi:predicted lipid carrier protein YhbT
MATVEECRKALEALVGRISELDADARAAHLADRSMSVTVTDLGVTFVTQLGTDRAGPVTEAAAGAERANIRFRTQSDELIAIAADPRRFARAWLTGRVKVDASLGDLLRLRKLL